MYMLGTVGPVRCNIIFFDAAKVHLILVENVNKRLALVTVIKISVNVSAN
jgi:hypothetical protein